MRGYLKAQLLLAPLLAAALPTRHDVNTPHALIKLDINNSEDDAPLQGPTLRLNVHESTSPCGYGNVTLNDQTLAQDENGAGSGSITTEQGSAILANWGFTCVHLEDEFQGQLMTFEVISVDDRSVDDVGFVVQFQQMAPVSVSLVNGTGSIIEVPVPSENADDNDSSNKDNSATLDGELAELKSMMRQLAALEYAISSKVHHISETYNFKVKRPGHFHSLSDCDSLKCVVKTMYVRAKHMASKLYGHGFEGEGPFGGRPGGHHWPFHHREGHHGHRPHWMPHHHENGNHSHPFPPHHPPHGPPHGPPPHGPPPHGPHGEPPFHHHPPPPPPPPFWEEHPPHGGPPPPPPPPPSHEFGDNPHHEHHGPDEGFPNEMGPPEDFDGERPEHPLFEDGEFPPPPPPPPPHHDGPPHEGHGPHGGPPHEAHGPHHHPPFGPPGLFHTISVIHIGAVVILLGLLASALHTRCFTKTRKNRRSSCGKRRGARGLRCRRHDDGFWASRRDAINARYSEIVRWVKEGARRQDLEDEEKEAIMRQIHGSEEEDNLSTTMEQEIAQFRAAASVVGDIVEAEEGRARSHEFPSETRQHLAPQHSAPVPQSPTSAFPDYVDEELPAYDEGSDDSRFVSDGFRYTPGSSAYTPSASPSTGSSLDENLGRKD